jgi:hypothetical protein
LAVVVLWDWGLGEGNFYQIVANFALGRRQMTNYDTTFSVLVSTPANKQKGQL